jgi:hypothetical protein
MNEPLTKDKEIDTTAYNQNDFRRNPGFLSPDVRSAVLLMKEHIRIIDEGRKELVEYTFRTREVLKLIDFCFPVFVKEK